MFVGHYGPSFAIKSISSAIPLWLLFIAVQFVDVLWAILVFLGVEKVRIVPGITATNPLDLYYMPYTHSLVGAMFWSLVVALVYGIARKRARWLAALWVAVAVFSHWVLDFLVHRPDLPLYDNVAKVGLGLWNYPVTAFVLEAALLFVGMWLYFRATRALDRTGRYGMIVFGVVMLAVQASVFFGPPPGSDREVAGMALFAYAVFAAVAYWLERKRIPRTA